MSRLYDPDLERFYVERDHLKIQISLAWEDDSPDMQRLQELQRRLTNLEKDMSRHTPAEA